VYTCRKKKRRDRTNAGERTEGARIHELMLISPHTDLLAFVIIGGIFFEIIRLFF
jgi:hypothetical protein